MKTVLLLSHSKDFFNIDRVMAVLSEKGVPFIRLNTDRFPEAMTISEQVDAHGFRVDIQTEDLRFSSRDIGAVWLRKIWTPVIHTEMEEKYHTASIRESIAVRKAFFQSLAHLPWIDPISTMDAAEDKFFQLRCAQQAGLRIPQTIISNDAQAVRQFYERLDGEMVCKLHTALSFGMQQDQFFFYTTQIQGDDLEELDLLSLCPMIFQEMIPKAYELRIAYIDGHCFAGKIQSAGLTDWRTSDPKEMRWEKADVPQVLQTQLQALMKKLGLSFGAIDVIRHTDGSYVFLEVNPSGEWGMLEKELDLPIAKTIANGLIQRLHQDSTTLSTL